MGTDAFCLRLFLYMFWGYLVRDLPLALDTPLFVAHHVVCMAGILACLWAPVGGFPVVLGIFTLEVGSLTFNSWCFDEALRELPDWFPCWPRCSGSAGRHIVTYSYYVTMSLSNIVGGYFLV